MNDEKQKLLEQLLLAIKIQDKIVVNSNNFDNNTKQAFLNHSKNLNELTKDKLSKSQIKSLSNDLLIYWRESIGPEVEMFWIQLKLNRIHFERKDELKFTLEKGRFRRVDQGIAARKHWNELKSLDSITARFLSEEIDNISDIIEKDENNRLKTLQKCLQKKTIPKTKILKYGECMAYFSQCLLFEKHFSKQEVEKLYEIWGIYNL